MLEGRLMAARASKFCKRNGGRRAEFQQRATHEKGKIEKQRVEEGQELGTLAGEFL